jgi:acetoin utilization protein AcuB
MTSLDMHEVNYLLNKTTVADIMEKRVVTINKEALLEEAAVMMRENGISVLPVVEAGNRLIGIITEKDIFSAFIDVLGYFTPGVRVVVNIHEDKKGVLEDLTDIFSDENINIQQIATYRKMGYVQVVIQLESKDIDGIRARLEEHGYEIGSIIYKPERV